MTVRRTIASWILVCGVSIIGTGCPRTPAATAPSRHLVTSDVTGPAASDIPEASNAHALTSKVTQVTVYSDRARVTRQATAELSTEPIVFAFGKLPGWVDDGSVRVSASAGRIVDVRVERSFLARATDKTWQKAKAQNEALKRRLEALDDEIAVLQAQKGQIEAIKAFSLEKINKDAVLGHIKVKSYGEVLAFIASSLRSTAKARRAVQRQRDTITPEYQASQRRLEEMKNLMKLEETTVLVTLQSSGATPCTIDLTYMIPGATWEPMHDLRVSTSDGKTAEIISFAVVTQTSGEDWRNAQLSFSTQSSVQSVRIPELEALTLGDTHSATRILTNKMSSFVRAQQAFQNQGQLWNKVHQKQQAHLNFDQVYKSKMEYLQVVEYPAELILETRRKRESARPNARSAPNMPYAPSASPSPAPRRKYEIGQQLMDLEAQF